MTIAVIDAAALVDILSSSPLAENVESQMRRASQVIAPAHLDAEAFSALARMQRAGALTDIRPHLEEVALLGIERYLVAPLLVPAAALLDRVAAKDALYIALAQSVGGWLLTTDERLRRAVDGLVPTSPPGS